jgi:hypothetical protein
LLKRKNFLIFGGNKTLILIKGKMKRIEKLIVFCDLFIITRILFCEELDLREKEGRKRQAESKVAEENETQRYKALREKKGETRK